MKMSKSLSFGDLSFKYMHRTQPALGLIVSRKYGGAVERNRFKRQCREIFKTIMIGRGAEIVLVVRAGKHNVSFSEIQTAFIDVYDQIFD